MSDSDGDVDENLPSREECEERCQKFASITATDSALAMFYLQDRAWDVNAAVNAYYGLSPPKQKDASSNSLSEAASSDSEPHRIRLLSWNIDGLDSASIRSRTLGACDVINKERPHVCFLQEVVASSQKIIEETCPLYKVIAGGKGDYFTAILLRKDFVQFEKYHIEPFLKSVMDRNCLHVHCKVKGVPFEFMTSHLESCKEHSTERKNQLRQMFSAMSKCDDGRTVVIGGDFNLRDNELAAVGMPPGVLDLWEVTGKRPEAKFTWDLKRNDNLEWNLKFRPQCRFDRVYLRHPTSGAILKPVYFELIGLERLKSCGKFPSDHWGILTHLNILNIKSD